GSCGAGGCGSVGPGRRQRCVCTVCSPLQRVEAHAFDAEAVANDTEHVVASDVCDPQSGGRGQGAEPRAVWCENLPATGLAVEPELLHPEMARTVNEDPVKERQRLTMRQLGLLRAGGCGGRECAEQRRQPAAALPGFLPLFLVPGEVLPRNGSRPDGGADHAKQLAARRPLANLEAVALAAEEDVRACRAVARAAEWQRPGREGRALPDDELFLAAEHRHGVQPPIQAYVEIGLGRAP